MARSLTLLRIAQAASRQLSRDTVSLRARTHEELEQTRVIVHRCRTDDAPVVQAGQVKHARTVVSRETAAPAG